MLYAMAGEKSEVTPWILLRYKVSEGGLEPPPSIRGLAPQASASAIPPPGLTSGKSSTIGIALEGVWIQGQEAITFRYA